MRKHSLWDAPELYESWFLTPKGEKILEKEKKLIEELLWNEKGSLLDIGCGTGIFSLFFKKMGFNVVGIDISFEMLRFFKKKDSLPLVKSDAQLLPFDDSSFDYAVFITVLEFLPYPIFAIIEAMRVTKKGIMIAFLPFFSLDSLKRTIKRLTKPSFFEDAYFFRYSEIEKMLFVSSKICRKKINLKKGSMLYPLSVFFLKPLASFYVIRVDYV